MPPAAPSLATLSVPLAVIALFWLAALYLAKKCRGGIFIRPDKAPQNAREKIKIIATKPIAWQTSLLIIEAEGHRFLLAAGRNGLTPIGALDCPSSPLPSSLTVPFPDSVL